MRRTLNEEVSSALLVRGDVGEVIRFRAFFECASKDDSEDEPRRMRSVDDLICSDHDTSLTSPDDFFVSETAAAVDCDLLTCEAGERGRVDRAGGSKKARASSFRVDEWTIMLLTATLDLLTTGTVDVRLTGDEGAGEAGVGKFGVAGE